MYFLNRLNTFFKKPGQIFRYKNKSLRYLYFQFSKFMHFKTYSSRVNKKKFPNLISDKSELIEKNLGFKLIKASKLSKNGLNIKELLKKIHKDLEKIDLTKFSKCEDGIIKLKTSRDFNNQSLELKFATNKYFIEIISRYLKCIPLLTNLSLWYSPNLKFMENTSQEYHLDHEDFKQVKGFLFINEVDINTGPLNIISAEQSNDIQKLINYKMTKTSKRVSDKTIQNLKKKLIIKENILTGNPGDLLLCDTSSCFHFGSRLGDKPKPRLILAFQYVTPFSFSMDWNWKNSNIPFKNYNFDNDLLLNKVTGNKI